MARKVQRMSQANNTPVGAIMQSRLTESQFQDINGTKGLPLGNGWRGDDIFHGRTVPPQVTFAALSVFELFIFN